MQAAEAGYWPVLKGGGDAEDPELAEDAAESQVGVVRILQRHYPRELLFADQTLLGSFYTLGTLVTTTCRGGVGGGLSAVASTTVPDLRTPTLLLPTLSGSSP